MTSSVERTVQEELERSPQLNPEDDEQILDVLLSGSGVTPERVPGFAAFMRTPFHHYLFTGMGQSLLSFLGLPLSRKQGKWQYLKFIARYLPEAAYHLWAKYVGERDGGDSCEPDRRHLLRELHTGHESWSQAWAFADCWRAVVCQAEVLQGEAVEHDFDRRFLWEELDKVLVESLTPRERRVLELRFGFFGNGEFTLEEAGEVFGLKGERIRQIEARAFRKLRAEHAPKVLSEFLK
ncbi:MAG: hypothetical protein A3J66_02955 [Candidatus Magasanikbacteria bacterium RIFCSPHIGHO2_02_FULL_47_14]|uniref:RNA polymerase sigma-70 region 4 domain-containing protein n=1 Tax=Candidatus Magasanikbacteria bacterium RIFCSPHIGHO2_02_FULL_47_14 TaxID=1798680 RepID=A0A1F6M4B6_9BACT|nr:MAG: hypothetical protein A3J66_02955 [Candidatus Magasanikbacteria bacterium RIFCSPHIGHO2_02_FULL_47_14]